MTRPSAFELIASAHDLQNSEFVIRMRWNISFFRPLQHEAIAANLAGRDSLVVMPTGGGKSLCFQGPAMLAHRGLTVVVSPLIALMRDQVDQLEARGIPAAAIDSHQLDHQRQDILRSANAGDLRLLYVSPEFLQQPASLAFLCRLPVIAFVIDEAHCISTWGHDFRLAYGELNRLRTLWPNVPIHAFTATAGPRVREHIIERLSLRDPDVLVGDFDRPNLFLRVEQRTWIDRQLYSYIADRPAGDCGIVYCDTRAQTTQLAEMLLARGIPAVAYHAGMEPELRASAQAAFMSGSASVVVATIAFGMGINKPDVRYILHASMPSSLELYHQEIGRAGRDGAPAECIIFSDIPGDLANWMDRLQLDGSSCLDALRTGHHGPEESRYTALLAMYDYCTNGDDANLRCRHALLVEHFNQTYNTENCAACDICTRMVGWAPPTNAPSTTTAPQPTGGS